MPAHTVVRALDALPDGTSLRYVAAVVLAAGGYGAFTTAYYVFGFYGLPIGVLVFGFVVFGFGSMVGRYAERPRDALVGAMVVAVVGTTAGWSVIAALSFVRIVAPASFGTLAFVGLVTLGDVAAILLGAFSGYVAI